MIIQRTGVLRDDALDIAVADLPEKRRSAAEVLHVADSLDLGLHRREIVSSRGAKTSNTRAQCIFGGWRRANLLSAHRNE